MVSVKRVIGGVVYDTDRAEEIAYHCVDDDLSDASSTLFRTSNGAFFEVVGDENGAFECINPLSDDDAKRFVERWANWRYEDFWPTAEPVPILESPVQTAERRMGDGIQVKKFPPYPSRGLVIAAANMLKAEGHSGFDALRLEYDLLQTDAGLGAGLAGRATSLAIFAINNPELRTPDGVYLQSAIVARAGDLYRSGTMNNIGEKERNAFKSASISAGTMNDVSESGEVNYLNADLYTGNSGNVNENATSKNNRKTLNSRKVFIVHGHDKFYLEMVARFLEKIQIEVIILHEQANRGRTIIEKIEAHGDVGFAVVLLTPDDTGARNGDEPRPRARQNVIMELGYFIAKLGRDKVCALKSNTIELPSDFDGVVYQNLDDGGGWRNALARELEEAGFEIDWRRVARA